MSEKIPGPQEYITDNPEFHALDKKRESDDAKQGESQDVVVEAHVEMPVDQEEREKLKQQADAVMKPPEERFVPSIMTKEQEVKYIEKSIAFMQAAEKVKKREMSLDDFNRLRDEVSVLDSSIPQDSPYKKWKSETELRERLRELTSYPDQSTNQPSEEKKETVDYTDVESLTGLEEKMRRNGENPVLIDLLSEIAENMARYPETEVTINSRIFEPFARLGGLKDKVFELVYTKPRQKQKAENNALADRLREEQAKRIEAEKKPAPIPPDQSPVQSPKVEATPTPADQNFKESAVEDNREDIPEAQEGEQTHEPGADSSDDVAWEDLEGVEVMGVGSATSLEGLYAFLSGAKIIRSPNGKTYTAEDLIRRMETARTISKHDGNIDWMAVEDVTSGPDKGGKDDLQTKFVQLLKKELGLSAETASEEAEAPENIQAADVDNEEPVIPKKESKLKRVFNVVKEKVAKEFLPDWAESLKQFSMFSKIRMEGMSDFGREVFGKLYEKTNLDAHIPNAVDRAKALYNDKIAFWQGTKAAENQKIIQTQEKFIATIQKALTTETSDWRKRKLELYIENAQNKIDAQQRALDIREEKRKHFEDQRNSLCQTMVGRIQEKLRPYDEKLEELGAKQEALTDAMDAFQAKREEFGKTYKELEAAAKGMPFRLRMTLRGQMGALRNQMKEADKAITKAKAQRFKLEKRVINAHQKANPWRTKQVEIKKILKRNNKLTK